MSKPTEPGYYWLLLPSLGGNDAAWIIVEVGEKVLESGTERCVYHPGIEYTFHTYYYADDQWGGRITQEPATDPPQPF